jgi:transposase
MPRTKKDPDELMDRAVRLVIESGRPVAVIARELGIGVEPLRKRGRRAEADSGARPDLPTTEEREEIKRRRGENHELRHANEILRSASVFFAKELDQDRTR